MDDKYMINMKSALMENRSNDSAKRGCLMAMVDKKFSAILNKANVKMIPEDILYKEGHEFGRETECHVTIRYGFIPDINELQIRGLLKGVTPFMITLIGIDMFKNPEEGFDVVKYSVQSDVLNRLNAASGKFPNENKYPDYKAHMTLAYVKPDSFTETKEGLDIQIPIKRVCYSPIKGGKSYFDL
jgi:hypothetical protein